MNKRPTIMRRILLSLIALAVYLVLLVLLVVSESSATDASITTFSDAIWYSIITISTVGYGDLYPVTLLGKLIGVLFVILSVGALAFVVGAMVSLITGRLLPQLQMCRYRKRDWYVFSCVTDASLTLADSIHRQDPKAIFFFPVDQQAAVSHRPECMFYTDTMQAAFQKNPQRCRLFFMEPDTERNYRLALEASHLGCPVYCQTDFAPAHCPHNLKLFDRYSCCAREYWNSYPLIPGKRTVLLLGNGRYAAQLLEQGLALNVFGQSYTTEYHIFGDWQHFLANHSQLAQTLCLNGACQAQDRLIVHEEDWNRDPALLYGADRIILCSDDAEENLTALQHLRKYFPVSGSIHLRTSHAISGENCFGTDAQIYTASMVLADGQAYIARTMHQIYCNQNGDSNPPWEELGPFLQQSNLAAADHLGVKIRMLLDDYTIVRITSRHCALAYARYCHSRAEQQENYRAIEHARWMRFHSLYNWQYAPQRDNDARRHPQMVPYEQLSDAEKAKDDYAWQLLMPMATALENNMEV